MATSAKNKDTKPLTEAEKNEVAKKKAEKKRIAALPDNQLTTAQLDARNRGKQLAAARKAQSGTTGTTATTTTKQNKTTVASKGDVLDKPVEFFHHNIKFTDFGYTNAQKQTVTPPNDEKKIMFETHTRKWVPDPQGKGSVARCSCRYETYSKKEAEYLRNHPYYGKTIFEKVEFIQSADPSVADIMETTAIRLVGITNNDLIARASALRIPIIQDLVELRRLVLEKLALDELRLRQDKLKGTVIAKSAKETTGVKDVY